MPSWRILTQRVQYFHAYRQWRDCADVDARSDCTRGQAVQHRMKDRVCTAGRATRAQELCESRGGLPGFPVPNSPYGLCGRKATLN